MGEKNVGETGETKLTIEEAKEKVIEMCAEKYPQYQLSLVELGNELWLHMSKGGREQRRCYGQDESAAETLAVMATIIEREEKKAAERRVTLDNASAGENPRAERFFYGVDSVMPFDVKPGIYRHKKGGLYRVLMTARDATNASDRDWMVVYLSMTFGETHVRRAAEFLELVPWPDGKTRPRFEYVGLARMAPGKPPAPVEPVPSAAALVDAASASYARSFSAIVEAELTRVDVINRATVDDAMTQGGLIALKAALDLAMVHFKAKKPCLKTSSGTDGKRLVLEIFYDGSREDAEAAMDAFDLEWRRTRNHKYVLVVPRLHEAAR